MPLNRGFDALRLNADVALRHACAAVLQKALDKRNVIAAFLVDFGGVPLAEAVGADPLKAQVIAHNGKLLLDCPFGQRKNAVIASDAVSQAIVFKVLPDDQWNSKNALLSIRTFVFGEL